MDLRFVAFFSIFFKDNDMQDYVFFSTCFCYARIYDFLDSTIVI